MRITIPLDQTENSVLDVPEPPRPRRHRFGKQRRDLTRAKFRRWFFRHFQNWYRDNEQRFALPLYLYRTRDKWIEIGVGQIPARKMRFSIAYKNQSFQDGSLSFFWGDEQIDNTCWMGTSTTRTAVGYICSECHRYGEDLRIFSTREALWEDHIFESILRQVNDTIALAERLEFRYSSECTIAKFVRQGEESVQPGKSERVVEAIPIRALVS